MSSKPLAFFRAVTYLWIINIRNVYQNFTSFANIISRSRLKRCVKLTKWRKKSSTMCINVSFYQAKVLWITSSGIFNLASRPLVKVHWKILYVLKMWLYIFCLWCNGTFTSTVKYFTWSYCVQSSGSTKSSPRMTVCQGSMCKEGCEVTVFIPRNLVSCNLCHTLYSHLFVCSTVGTGFLVHLVRQCVRVQCAQTGVKSPINLVTFAIHYIAVCSCVAR